MLSKRLFSLFILINSYILAVETPMDKQPIAVIETNQGTIEVALKPDVAPKAVENFMKLAEKGYYKDVIFHRVIKGFMIQGGDPTGTGRGGQSIWDQPFADEFSQEVKFDRPGLLAMANAGRNTNGSQFFITTAPTSWLDMKHTIFGEVIKGYDIVQKIENTKTGPGDRPVEPQKIIQITFKNRLPT
jgi:peptidylprolyl isomerase